MFDMCQAKRPHCHLRTVIKRHVNVVTANMMIGGMLRTGAINGVNLAASYRKTEMTIVASDAIGEAN